MIDPSGRQKGIPIAGLGRSPRLARVGPRPAARVAPISTRGPSWPGLVALVARRSGAAWQASRCAGGGRPRCGLIEGERPAAQLAPISTSGPSWPGLVGRLRGGPALWRCMAGLTVRRRLARGSGLIEGERPAARLAPISTAARGGPGLVALVRWWPGAAALHGMTHRAPEAVGRGAA